jgi:hypothetical protein
MIPYDLSQNEAVVVYILESTTCHTIVTVKHYENKYSAGQLVKDPTSL